HVNRMLEYGVTRVELGVQTLKDSVYAKVKRGHSVEDVINATKMLRDAGLKVGYHMMPGLFSDFDEDLDMFRTLFNNERFRPDFLKIYPTLVIEGTRLYELWKKGEYQPYGDDEAVELIYEIKRLMPKWVRTMRIQRDIPKRLIAAGVKRGDIGAIVHKRLDGSCRCIRCRDVGHLAYGGKNIDSGNAEILTEKYTAGGGTEYFISVEDTKNDALIAYLRLRLGSCAVIRELRVLGPMVPLGGRIDGAEQHKGWGSMLLGKAEEICTKDGRERILVTSAIGTRDYYRRHGYTRHGPYMEKPLLK
ncbi:MAG: tRNA uridine(34) 5-carboxymethylaminomethyl modification radical SAM/GNAT enzyme Elp3, partial [Candidatus Hydrothermarchaeaceae archaeon]